MDQKYELTSESRVNDLGVTVHRIRAVVDIPRWGVKAGDLGGWIESEKLANGTARVSGNAQVSGDAQVGRRDHLLTVGPIGSEGVTAMLCRTTGDGHALVVGCWTGTVDTLMAEVKRRRQGWCSDDATRDRWTAQYKALRDIGRATVTAWEKAAGTEAVAR